MTVYDRAQELYNQQPTPTAAELARALSKEQGRLGSTPEASTLTDWIAKGWITLDPADAPWTLVDSDPEDAALVLPVVRWAAENGRPRPTREIATWIIRLRRISQGSLDPASGYHLAQHARRSSEDVRRVEQYMSYEPWTDEGAIALSKARELGRLDFDLTFMEGGAEPQRRERRHGR